jgi:uncharacterized membrane protein
MPEALLMVGLTNILLFKYLSTARPAYFVQLYILTIALKLFAFGGFCLWMVMADRAGAALNIVFFMGVYFIFTAVEITFLFNKISRGNEPRGDSKNS